MALDTRFCPQKREKYFQAACTGIDVDVRRLTGDHDGMRLELEQNHCTELEAKGNVTCLEWVSLRPADDPGVS